MEVEEWETETKWLYWCKPCIRVEWVSSSVLMYSRLMISTTEMRRGMSIVQLGIAVLSSFSSAFSPSVVVLFAVLDDVGEGERGRVCSSSAIP